MKNLLQKLPLAFFGLWLILLSGILNPYVNSPGVIQAVRLQKLFVMKKTELDQAQQEISNLRKDVKQLETNSAAQQREIRQTLGYVAKDELIFEFAAERIKN